MGSVIYISALQLRRLMSNSISGSEEKWPTFRPDSQNSPKQNSRQASASENWPIVTSSIKKREQFQPVVEQNVRGPDLV